jgi:hypothetical protein
VGWWRPAAWKQFKTQLPEWMDSQLEHWQEQALATDAKERQVRRELEKMVSIELPIGVGALSWITLELEIGVLGTRRSTHASSSPASARGCQSFRRFRLVLS